MVSGFPKEYLSSKWANFPSIMDQNITTESYGPRYNNQ